MNSTVRTFTQAEALAGSRALVVGAGASGPACARLLASCGAEVVLADRNPDAQVDLPEGYDIRLELGPHSIEQFERADLVVLSSGVLMADVEDFLGSLPPRKVMPEIDLAAHFIQRPIIAVTGSNGKTTTTRIIAAMLEKSGVTPYVCGNIMPAACTAPFEADAAEVLVMEISSFQSQSAKFFHPHVAVLLNIAPNHLDRHESFDEYFEAKLNLFARMTEDDVAILPESMRSELEDRPELAAPRKVWFEADVIFEAPHLYGEHNRENVAAAWLAANEMGATKKGAQKALTTYRPDAHRLQRIGEKAGVMFVDDSKATTLTAVMAAVQSFDAPVRLLMGGRFKGGDVAELAAVMKDRVVEVALYGGSRSEFEPVFEKDFAVSWHQTMEEAVQAMWSGCAFGDVVLLSPGTASFDQYKSYAARGDDFARIFGSLNHEQKERQA